MHAKEQCSTFFVGEAAEPLPQLNIGHTAKLVKNLNNMIQLGIPVANDYTAKTLLHG